MNKSIMRVAIVVVAIVGTCLAAVLIASATPGPIVTIRAEVDGRPLEGVLCYPIPSGVPQGSTDSYGVCKLSWSLLDAPGEVDICVIAPDGRRTEYGECVTKVSWWDQRTIVVDFTGRSPWPGFVTDLPR